MSLFTHTADVGKSARDVFAHVGNNTAELRRVEAAAALQGRTTGHIAAVLKFYTVKLITHIYEKSAQYECLVSTVQSSLLLCLLFPPVPSI